MIKQLLVADGSSDFFTAKVTSRLILPLHDVNRKAYWLETFLSSLVCRMKIVEMLLCAVGAVGVCQAKT